MGLEDSWAECDRCGTCVRGVERRVEVLCKDCAAADGSLLREGR